MCPVIQNMSISIGEVAAIQFDLWYVLLAIWYQQRVCDNVIIVPHRSKPVQMKYAGAQVPEACQERGRRGCRRRPSHNASPRRRRTKSTPQRSRDE